jgi:hypothetical protein
MSCRPCSATVLVFDTDNRGLVVRNAGGCIVVHDAEPCRSVMISAWQAEVVCVGWWMVGEGCG